MICFNRSVLLTGATGYIAGQLLPALRERYDLRLTDVRRENRAGQPIEGVVVADLLDAEPSALAALVAAASIRSSTAVAWCLRAKIRRSQYDGERRNVDMMQRIYQLALDHGVRRWWPPAPTEAARVVRAALLRRPARPRRP